MSLCRSREQTYQKRNTYLSNEWKFLDLLGILKKWKKQGELSTREAFLRYIELLYEWKN